MLVSPEQVSASDTTACQLISLLSSERRNNEWKSTNQCDLGKFWQPDKRKQRKYVLVCTFSDLWIKISLKKHRDFLSSVEEKMSACISSDFLVQNLNQVFRWMMPFSDSNVPSEKHYLDLKTQTKPNPLKEQSVQKLHTTHSASQMQNNWTHKEENKQGRQPEHNAWLRQQQPSSSCITEVGEWLHKQSLGHVVPCVSPEAPPELPGVPAAS